MTVHAWEGFNFLTKNVKWTNLMLVEATMCAERWNRWFITSWTLLAHRFLASLQLKLYFLNMNCVSAGRVFFPTGLLVIYFEGRPWQSISTSVDRQPMEHSQTTWTQVLVLCIWDLRSHLAEVVIKAKTLTGGIFPSANQRASLSFMLKLIGWWHLDSLQVR